MDLVPQSFAEIPIIKDNEKVATLSVNLPEITKENQGEVVRVLLRTLQEMEAEVLFHRDLARRALRGQSTLIPRRRETTLQPSQQ